MVDRMCRALERGIAWIGAVVAWATLIPLVVVSVYHIVGRQFFNTGSTRLQELEWHFFLPLVMLCALAAPISPTPGMACASCAAKIEAAKRKIEGVNDVRVSIASQAMTLNVTAPAGQLRAVKTAGPFISTSPLTIRNAAAKRRLLDGSPKSKMPIRLANNTEVSRKAATCAIGPSTSA